MSRLWIEPEEVLLPHSFSDAIKGHPLIAQTLYRRGLKDYQSVQGFLDPACYHPASPFELPDMDVAVALLTKAIHTGQQLCVWGDFDVDGQTATTLLVSALHRLNANVIHHIPVRARESHGVSVSVLQEYISQGIALLLTCDTGIAAVQAVQLANQVGIPVIITDHHDLPVELPNAQAIINPKRLTPNHPLYTLPGVGVAYKLAEALFIHNHIESAAGELLDLAALGIVADLATIHGETRHLLQIGLPVLREMHRLGLRMMTELAELNPQNITEDHISFVLAPRLNALGRLGDANTSVEFLTTNDPLRARILAYELEGLNANRRLLSEQIYRAALAQLESDPSLGHDNIIILGHPTWLSGVIGIAAARLVERFQKPVILFSTSSDEPARGSARSIAGVNISTAIATQAHLLEGFGGHPMAAGLSIMSARIPEFRRGISRAIDAQIPAGPPDAGLLIDGYIQLKDLSLELVSDIERLAPFGAGNPPVTLSARNLSLSGYTAVGKHGEHLLMTLEDELGYTQQAIWWQGADQSIPDNKFDLAFTVRASNYRGQKGVQLEWIASRPSSTPVLSGVDSHQDIEVIDYRLEAHPLVTLSPLLSTQDLQIWCETDNCPDLPILDRLSLSPCSTLVIWAPPPAASILHQALQTVKPRLVYLFGNSTSMDQSKAFLKRLAGLCKFMILHNSGHTHLSKLAAASNQRLEAVTIGLRWLQAHGHIQILEQQADLVSLAFGCDTASNPNRSMEEALQSLLNESAAYRKYYLREDKNHLINFAQNRIK
jgi:single-stranded-DNA-specific exonuclease